MVPSREIFWNIQFGEILYVLAVIVVGILIYAIYRRYKLWQVGRPDNRLGVIFKGQIDWIIRGRI